MIEENEFVNIENQDNTNIPSQIDVRKATRQANMLKARQAKLAKQKQAKLNPVPKPIVQTYQYEDETDDDDDEEEEYVIQPMKHNNYFTQPPIRSSLSSTDPKPIKPKKLSHYNPIPQQNNEVLERLNYLENMFSNIAVKNNRKAKPKTKAKKSIQIIQTPVQTPSQTSSIKNVIKNNPDLLNNLKGVFGY